MAKSTIAQPGQEPQTRIERGRKLYAEHADEIWFDRRLRCWIVPSENDGTSVYEVILRRDEETCVCRSGTLGTQLLQAHRCRYFAEEQNLPLRGLRREVPQRGTLRGS
jgi:hypothetical protein